MANLISKIKGFKFKYLFLALSIVAFFFMSWYISSYVFKKRFMVMGDEGVKRVYSNSIQKSIPLKTIEFGDFTYELKEYKDKIGVLGFKLIFGIHEENEMLSQEITKRNLQLKDMIRTLIIEKTFEDLNDIYKRDILKKEMLNMFNSVLVSGKIEALYFNRFSITMKE